jgi:hypothetical protein
MKMTTVLRLDPSAGGLAGPSDAVAAENIRRAAGSRPNATGSSTES